MTVDTLVSLQMCVLVLVDVIDGCKNKKGHSRKLSSGDERTLRGTFKKLQKGTSLFTSERIHKGQDLGHVDVHLSSAHQELQKNLIFFLIIISSCKMGIHVKHSGCKRCLGITWTWNVLRCLFSIMPRSPGLNAIEIMFCLVPKQLKKQGLQKINEKGELPVVQ